MTDGPAGWLGLLPWAVLLGAAVLIGNLALRNSPDRRIRSTLPETPPDNPVNSPRPKPKSAQRTLTALDYKELGNHEFDATRWSEALHFYDKALEICTETQLRSDLHYNRSFVLNELGDGEAALAALEHAAAAATVADADFPLLRGRILENLKGYAYALECYEQASALSTRPEQLAKATSEQAYALCELSRAEEGLSICEDLQRRREADGLPPDCDLLMIGGYALNLLERYEESLVALDQAAELQLESETEPYWWLEWQRGDSLLRLVLEQWHEVEADEDLQRVGSAEWYGRERQINLERALELLAAAQRTCPPNLSSSLPYILWSKAVALQELDRSQEAMAAYVEAERLFTAHDIPAPTGVAASYAWLSYTLHDYIGALDAAEAALSRAVKYGEPAPGEAHWVRALCFVKLGSMDQACCEARKSEAAYAQQGERPDDIDWLLGLCCRRD